MSNRESYCRSRHDKLFQLAAEIQSIPNFAVIDAFRILVDETERTFAQEQKLMESSASPAMQHHLEQHARVLVSLHSAHMHSMQGDIVLARKVGSYLLTEWLKRHASTLDLALDTWVKGLSYPMMNALIGKHINKEATISLHHISARNHRQQLSSQQQPNG